MFKKSLLVLCFALLTVSCSAKEEAKTCPLDAILDRDDSRPNIILIVTDDQPPDTIDMMPTLRDELAAQGIVFTDGFVTTPLCCPSRASIFSGLYAHNHNVHNNRPPDGGAPAFDASSTIATWLSDSGYQTAFFGKYMNSYELLEPAGVVPPGWGEWKAFMGGTQPHQLFYNYSMSDNGEIIQFGDAPDDLSTDVISNFAYEYIVASDGPFFMEVSYYAPHQPRRWAERHDDMFRTNEQVTARRPPNFNEEDISDKPAWLGLIGREDGERNNTVYQQALRSLQAVDDGIRDILSALDCIGQRENTMIVFISDNGVTWGEHGIPNGKNCPYEECIHIPFVVYYPGGIDQPHEDDRLVLNIDLAPTFADLAGAPVPVDVDGTSFLSLFNDGGDMEWRSDFLFEHWPTNEGDGSLVPEFYGVRTTEWKYVEYVTGEHELYDLVNDPYELENLFGLPGYEEIAAQLAEALATKMAESR